MDDHCKEIKAALQNNDQALAAKLVQEQMENIENVPLVIAITGESGSGKSTLVNALREVDNKDEGAAPTGVVETTMKPTEYLHPNHPNIKIWDLPGIENDAKLAQEIQKMKKKFYFVRSKIDHNIQDAKRSQRDFNEENTLKRIRDNCTEELQKLGIQSPKIFLVSGFDLHLYEFKALYETLEKELPEHQRDALLLALPNISLDVINKKKEVLKAKIIWYSLASAAGAAVPVPGISTAMDLAIIVKFVIECQKSLGLSGESLLKLSHATGVPIEDLKAQIKSPLSGVTITKELVMTVFRTSIALMAAFAVEEVTRFVPLIGIPVAMTVSFTTNYIALRYLLKTLGEDAQRVFTKALGLPASV